MCFSYKFENSFLNLLICCFFVCLNPHELVNFVELIDAHFVDTLLFFNINIVELNLLLQFFL